MAGEDRGAGGDWLRTSVTERRKKLGDKQREMRERMKAASAPLSDTAVQATLARIKEAPVTSNDDFIALLGLIKSLARNLEPSAIFVLQLEANLRHYNATKKPEDAAKTFADALSLAVTHVKGGPDDST